MMWQDYDPNWREFNGTIFQMILIEYPDRISPELAQRLYKSIDMAVEGEKVEGRLVPTYTNPSLMYGILWDFAAVHDKRADWRKESEDWIESVYSLFKKYDAFSEFNSAPPTMASTCLRWRCGGNMDPPRKFGWAAQAACESGLWKDIGSFFQPGDAHVVWPLRPVLWNGKYGRWACGVDALCKGCEWQAAGHRHRCQRVRVFLPPWRFWAARIPEDALRKMQKVEGDHFVKKQISDQRTATAWIGKNLAFGGEATSKTRDVGHFSQFHPVTIQWRTPSGEIAWVRVAESPMMDATADEHGISISTTGTIRFRVHANAVDQAPATQTFWGHRDSELPVSSDAQGPFTVQKTDPATLDPAMQRDEGTDMVYSGITKMRLEIKWVAQ